MIVDASVLLHAFLPDDLNPDALKVVREHASGKIRLKAPALLPYELCNAVWQVERRGRITRSQAELNSSRNRLAGEGVSAILTILFYGDERIIPKFTDIGLLCPYARAGLSQVKFEGGWDGWGIIFPAPSGRLPGWQKPQNTWR